MEHYRAHAVHGTLNTTERYELTGGALEIRKIASHMLSHEKVCHVLSYKNVCRLNQWFQGCHRAT